MLPNKVPDRLLYCITKAVLGRGLPDETGVPVKHRVPVYDTEILQGYRTVLTTSFNILRATPTVLKQGPNNH